MCSIKISSAIVELRPSLKYIIGGLVEDKLVDRALILKVDEFVDDPTFHRGMQGCDLGEVGEDDRQGERAQVEVITEHRELAHGLKQTSSYAI